jgi:hypothetical protein
MPSSFRFWTWTLSLLAPALLHAGDGVPRYYNVSSGGASPLRDMIVEHYRSDQPGFSPVAQQIWLVSTLDPARRRLLFTHERDALVLFSNDEKWLVINDHILSNQSRLLLFRRKTELEYEQVADLTEAAWHFFDEQQRHKWKNSFDHNYVEALRWAGNDPPTLLLILDGHADSRNYTSEWYCFYDVQSKAFSTDLEAHNRRSTLMETE